MVVPRFWIPEDNIEARVNRDHVPYDRWGAVQMSQNLEELGFHRRAFWTRLQRHKPTV
ncbi:hypothetical protein NXS08_03115 [Gleimia sp. 6138-11-ORH1]|nr:hypothetical protein [Gleimia sp. 6138-11-ORH1]